MHPIERIMADHQSARSLEDANADLCFLALSEDNEPTVRTLILRGITDEGFTLFINKTSAKWQSITRSSRGELLLWYPTVQRQYRVRGTIEEMDRSAIEKNWPRRPAGSKYLDYAYTTFAPQSTEIESHDALVKHVETFRAGNTEDSLTTPDIATGIMLKPLSIESLDLNSPERIHDRRRYTLENGHWKEAQLMP